ncbi:MAG TPA: transketolase C-terminal domain-containing protein [Acidimicrobiia bacterium]
MPRRRARPSRQRESHWRGSPVRFRPCANPTKTPTKRPTREPSAQVTAPRGRAVRRAGWGAELVSIVAEERFYDLDGPLVRITTPHIPLPAANDLEDAALPSVARIVETVRKNMG